MSVYGRCQVTITWLHYMKSSTLLFMHGSIRFTHCKMDYVLCAILTAWFIAVIITQFTALFTVLYTLGTGTGVGFLNLIIQDYSFMIVVNVVRDMYQV